jgi:hypothetical protein
MQDLRRALQTKLDTGVVLLLELADESSLLALRRAAAACHATDSFVH